MMISNHENANRMLGRLLQAGGYGVVSLDTEGGIQAMNQAAARLLDAIPDRSNLAGQNFFALFSASEQITLRSRYQAMSVSDELVLESAMPTPARTAADFRNEVYASDQHPYSARHGSAFPAAQTAQTAQGAHTADEVLTAIEPPLKKPDHLQQATLRQTVLRTESGWSVLLEQRVKAVRPQVPSRREVLYRTLARSMPQTGVLLFDERLMHILAEGELFSRETFISWEIEGQMLTEAFPPQFVEALKPLYRTALNGAVSVVELAYEGSHYNIFVQPVHDDQGEVLAGMCVIMDVTLSKQTENALRASEQRIRALLNALPDQIYLMNRTGEITNLIVYDSVHDTDLVDAPTFGVVPTLSHNALNQLPRQMVDELHAHLLIALDARTVSSFEYELTQAKVEESYEARIIALDENEHEAMIVVRDMTTLKQVQSELRQRVQELTVLSQVEAELTEQLNLGYVLTIALDAALRLSKAEAGFVATIVDEQFDQIRVSGAFPALDLTQFRAQENSAIVKALQSREIVSALDTHVSGAVQTILPNSAACIVCPIIWRDQVIALLNLEFRHAHTFTDHTLDVMKTIMARTAVAIDNSRMYQQTASHLQEMQMLYDRVSKLETLKTEMIRIASHDLRNPLSVILSYIGMIRSDLNKLYSDGAWQLNTPLEYLANVEVAAQQMRKIILNILSLERIEEMAKEAQFDNCNLEKLVEQGYFEARGLAQLKSQAFSRHLEVTNPMVKADPMQLGEAITNLLSNAIKYTPDEGRIEIRLEQIGSNLVFSVIDNGYGIKESQQARLFEPFYRAYSPETREIDGSGLGLHLVRKIIERHGGELFFTSIYRQGSTFGFTIPYLTDASS